MNYFMVIKNGILPGPEDERLVDEGEIRDPGEEVVEKYYDREPEEPREEVKK